MLPDRFEDLFQLDSDTFKITVEYAIENDPMGIVLLFKHSDLIGYDNFQFMVNRFPDGPIKLGILTSKLRQSVNMIMEVAQHDEMTLKTAQKVFAFLRISENSFKYR